MRGRGASNLNAALKNPRILNAVSSMPTNNFGKGAVSGREHIDQATFRQGGMLTGRVPVVPTRESLRPVDKAASLPANATREAGNERFFSKRQPAPAPKPFHEQVAQVQKMINDSPTPKLMAEARTPSDVAAASRNGVTGELASGTRNGGSKTFDPASNNNPKNNSGSNNSTQARAGWRTFGGRTGDTTQQETARLQQNATEQNSGQSNAAKGPASDRNATQKNTVRNASTDRNAAAENSTSRNSGERNSNSAPATKSGGSASRGSGWRSFSRSGSETVNHDGAINPGRQITGPRTTSDSGSSAPASGRVGQDRVGQEGSAATRNGFHKFSSAGTSSPTRSTQDGPSGSRMGTRDASRGSSSDSVPQNSGFLVARRILRIVGKSGVAS